MKTDDDLSLDAPIWGAANIAAEIRKPIAQTFYLLSKGLVDADKIGRQWVSTRRRLRDQFAGAKTANGVPARAEVA